MYRRVFIISKPVNGKRKQTLKLNFYSLNVFTYSKILNFRCHTNEQRSNKYTNQTSKQCFMFEMYMSVHNTINVSKVIYKCRAPILLLPVANLSSILIWSEIPMPSDGFLFDLLEPWDVRALSIRKTADLLLQLWVGTFSRFVAIGFYFLS
jgi:hypothetical protein